MLSLLLDLIVVVLFAGLAFRFDYACWPGVVAAGAIGFLVSRKLIQGRLMKRPDELSRLLGWSLYALAFYLVLAQVFGVVRSPKWLNQMFYHIEKVNHSMRGVTPTATPNWKLPPMPEGTVAPAY